MSTTTPSLPSDAESPAPPRDGEIPHDIARVPRRRWGIDLIAVVTAVAVLVLLVQILTNPNMGWPTIVAYLLNPQILSGLGVTLTVTVASMAIALVVGLVIASMRLSGNKLLVSLSWVYVWFFRSVPTLVLLLIVYNIAILLPRISVGIPGGPTWLDVPTSSLMNGFVAGIGVLGLQQAAYTSEVIRAAMQSVPVGQTEAAYSLGMKPSQRLWTVVLPQAFRVALPPIANDTINLMKSTSLLAFIAVTDLLYSTQLIYSRTYQIIPLLMVACLWYVLLVSVLSVGQAALEASLATSDRFTLRTWWNRLRTDLTRPPREKLASIDSEPPR